MEKYYVSNGAEVFGPWSVSELAVMLERRELDRSFPVCREGTESWVPIGSVLPQSMGRPRPPAPPAPGTVVAQNAVGVVGTPVQTASRLPAVRPKGIEKEIWEAMKRKEARELAMAQNPGFAQQQMMHVMVNKKSEALTAILGFFIPGGGYLISGNYILAIGMFLLIGGIGLILFPIGPILMFIPWLLTLFHALGKVKRHNAALLLNNRW